MSRPLLPSVSEGSLNKYILCPGGMDRSVTGNLVVGNEPKWRVSMVQPDWAQLWWEKRVDILRVVSGCCFIISFNPF